MHHRAIVLLALLLPACTYAVEAPAVAPDATAYATVLASFVDDGGRVDYEGLATSRETLLGAYATVAAESPRSRPDAFPTRDDALAYWIDAGSRTTLVSPIFDWFSEDFGDLLPFLIRHAEGDRRRRLERARAEGWTIGFFEYDWTLNGRG